MLRVDVADLTRFEEIRVALSMQVDGTERKLGRFASEVGGLRFPRHHRGWSSASGAQSIARPKTLSEQTRMPFALSLSLVINAEI